MKMLIFNSFVVVVVVVVKVTKEEKTKRRMDLFHSVIYLLYNSK